MAALSDNKYDVYNWIKSIITSMENTKHYIVCNKLIQLFYRKHQDWDLRDALDSELTKRVFELGSNKKEAKRLLKG